MKTVAHQAGSCGSNPAEQTVLLWQTGQADGPANDGWEAPSQTRAASRTETHQPTTAPSNRLRRVLLVDDSGAYRRALKMVIEGLGEIEVAEAESGEEALEGLFDASPQLVFMDINLPGINGIETTARLLEVSPSSVVIGLSIYTDPQTRDAIINAGALTLLNKESDISAVLAMVDEYL